MNSRVAVSIPTAGRHCPFAFSCVVVIFTQTSLPNKHTDWPNGMQHFPAIRSKVKTNTTQCSALKRLEPLVLSLKISVQKHNYKLVIVKSVYDSLLSSITLRLIIKRAVSFGFPQDDE